MLQVPGDLGLFTYRMLYLRGGSERQKVAVLDAQRCCWGFLFVRLLVGAESLKRHSAVLRLAGDISRVVIWGNLGLPERKETESSSSGLG